MNKNFTTSRGWFGKFRNASTTAAVPAFNASFKCITEGGNYSFQLVFKVNETRREEKWTSRIQSCKTIWVVTPMMILIFNYCLCIISKLQKQWKRFKSWFYLWFRKLVANLGSSEMFFKIVLPNIFVHQ